MTHAPPSPLDTLVVLGQVASQGRQLTEMIKPLVLDAMERGYVEGNTMRVLLQNAQQSYNTRGYTAQRLVERGLPVHRPDRNLRASTPMPAYLSDPRLAEIADSLQRINETLGELTREREKQYPDYNHANQQAFATGTDTAA